MRSLFENPIHAYISTTRHRIAIIGSGAAGASAAYSLHQAAISSSSSQSQPSTNDPIQLDVTLYEKNSVIGGRVNEITIDLPSDGTNNSVMVETGASIFLKTNKNLYEAAKKFNLQFSDDDSNGKDTSLGIYDGNHLIFKTTGYSSIYDAVKSFWRYGFSSPLTVYRATQEATKKFYKTYNDTKAWDTWGEWFNAHNFSEYLNITTREYLKGRGVNDKFIDEIVEPITRVNYGQNTNINSLAGLVVLNALFGDVKQLKDGNSKIFEKMLQEAASTVKIKLNTKVDKVFRLAPGTENGILVESTYKKKDGSYPQEKAVFDYIIIACPIHQSGIDFPNLSLPKPVPYVELHVTFVVGKINSSSFGLPSDRTSKLPRSILTTNNPAIPFLSLGTIATSSDKKTSITKLFSRKHLSDDDLLKYFSKIKEVVRKVWNSYPILTTDVVDRGMIELADKLYYVNGFESAFSTMESEIVATANVVRMIKSRIIKEQHTDALYKNDGAQLSVNAKL